MKRFLTEILFDLPFPVTCRGEIDGLMVSGITADSRKVEPGNIFVAVKGKTVDSHTFIPDAVLRGAKAIVGSEEFRDLNIPYIRVENTRQVLAYLAAGFYAYPSRKMVMIGVTGTDGKTTTCSLIHEILKAAGVKAGLISTVHAVIGDHIVDTGYHVTTPEAIEIQKFLYEMVVSGTTHCVLETTSHGWAQYRTDVCDFDIGVVTNITHEHLDEHGDFNSYREAKARLLESLSLAKKDRGKPGRLAVLNQDEDSFSFLKKKLDGFKFVRSMGYGLMENVDIRASDVKNSAQGQSFKLTWGSNDISITSSLVGNFNIYNCLASLGATVVGLGIDPQDAVIALKNFVGVPGRMERIYLGQQFTAIVDFAHTPNALSNALSSVRQFTSGKVICVFGSAGLRDREKRRMMAEVSTRMADFSIFTAEDPRTESLEAILGEMAETVKSIGFKAGESWLTIPDRGQAIRTAVGMAKAGDVVIVCGKGHEQSMCFGTIEFPWDDRVAIRSAISDSLHIPGPQMPWLPTSK